VAIDDRGNRQTAFVYAAHAHSAQCRPPPISTIGNGFPRNPTDEFDRVTSRFHPQDVGILADGDGKLDLQIPPFCVQVSGFASPADALAIHWQV